jgi:hypothetical protein
VARLECLLESVPQIRDIICMGRLLRFLNHGLLVSLRHLRAHDLDLVVSTIIVSDFAAGNRISNSEIEGLLLCAGKNVCQFDCEDKAVRGAIGKGPLVQRGDLRCCLSIVEREAHRNPFFEYEIAHANTLSRRPNQLDVLDSDIKQISSQW